VSAEGENNPHSRRIFSAKWGRLKNAFDGMGIDALQAGATDENGLEQVVDTCDLDIINDAASLTNR